MSSNSATTKLPGSLKRPLEQRQVEENEDTDTYSLQDVIDCEKEQNEIANAVLGASDANNCSYNQGYVYRQALYCCITCLKENNTQSDSSVNNQSNLHGICLACSYECHANHELCELYTKRNFRCDCGNAKFSNKKVNTCKLQPNKEPLNTLNKYNHNFKGEYCTCNKSYPEEVSNDGNNSADGTQGQLLDENSDEMLQCTICEDWFHLNHLNGHEKYTIFYFYLTSIFLFLNEN
jgi:E3 ubiquitin-protein ligase UBR7